MNGARMYYKKKEKIWTWKGRVVASADIDPMEKGEEYWLAHYDKIEKTVNRYTLREGATMPKAPKASKKKGGEGSSHQVDVDELDVELFGPGGGASGDEARGGDASGGEARGARASGEGSSGSRSPTTKSLLKKALNMLGSLCKAQKRTDRNMKRMATKMNELGSNQVVMSQYLAEVEDKVDAKGLGQMTHTPLVLEMGSDDDTTSKDGDGDHDEA